METEPNYRQIKYDWRDCAKHGWSALGLPCPKCLTGDAPRNCRKHGWSHLNKGCPDCEKGKP